MKAIGYLLCGLAVLASEAQADAICDDAQRVVAAFNDDKLTTIRGEFSDSVDDARYYDGRVRLYGNCSVVDVEGEPTEYQCSKRGGSEQERQQLLQSLNACTLDYRGTRRDRSRQGAVRMDMSTYEVIAGTKLLSITVGRTTFSSGNSRVSVTFSEE
jgi:hypothetical protein